jgi:enoyl-CoA hydratase/3-hydroxyacyl-CoA dehydrogenase
VLEALKSAMEAAQGDARVKAIVITGTQGKFSGGFDITQLKARSEVRLSFYTPKAEKFVRHYD